MEFKGTPGKWNQSHRPIPNDEDGMYDTQIYCEEGKTIATVSWYLKPKERGVHEGKPVLIQGTYREANAKLIAAAPDLLEALQALVFLKELKDKGRDNEAYLTAKPIAWENAKKAIEKALTHNLQPTTYNQ